MVGSLIFLDGVSGIGYDEMAEITLQNGQKRYGRVIQLDGKRAVLQVFEGTKGISLENARTNFTADGLAR
jgi:V/A-type H+-transporting ATPase subunit B